MKPPVWLGSSRDDLREFFSEAARKAAGYQLFKVQSGLEPDDWRTMAVVGAGAFEVRIHEINEYRVLYVAKFPEAVYILHAFVKKTRRTSGHDLKLAAARYQELVEGRRRR